MGASLVRDINEIDVDTDVVNIGKYQIPNTNIKTPMDVEQTKLFVIYQIHDGKRKLKVISVKLVENSLFVYITDVDTHEINLLHVARLSSLFTSDNTIQHVQISRDFKYIALPEEQSINIYTIEDFAIVDTVNINLTQVKNKLTLNVDTTQNKTVPPQVYIDLSNRLENNSEKIYRCILFDKAYVVILINKQMIAKFIFLFFTENMSYEMSNFDIDLTKTLVRFSYSGKYMLLYDTTTKYATIYDIYSSIGTNVNAENIPLLHTITLSETLHSIINISDDGQFVLCGNTDGAMHIVNLAKGKTFKFESGTLQHVAHVRYTILNFCTLSSNDNTNKSYIYVLLGWNKVNLHVTCSIIIYANETYSFVGPVVMKINLSNDPIYTYSNGTIFVYRTMDGMAIFNVNKLLPVRVANLLASRIKLLLPDDEHENSAYFNSVALMGADGSSKTYAVHRDARFLLDMKKSSSANKFMLGFASNVNIVDDLQSFTIFIGIMSGCIKQKEIINKIFGISKSLDRHTMMHTLVEHLVEYIKIFITGHNREMRQQFAIYVVCSLVFRYYNRIMDEHANINRNLFDVIVKFSPCMQEFCATSATMILDL